MYSLFTYAAYSISILLASTALFFFSVTRGALLLRGFNNKDAKKTSHIYPVFSSMRLIRLVDCQPLISAILLFQYPRLVSTIVKGLKSTDLSGKTVLFTSCAFGNVMPRVIGAAFDARADKVIVTDLIQNEINHARTKLAKFKDKIEYHEEDATAMKMANESVDANVIFFLLHELPVDLQRKTLDEAVRVLKPGGKLYLAEFHRPGPLLLRALSWIYFKVFEPFGLALWGANDPVNHFKSTGGFTCEREIVFFGNYQVMTITKAI